VDIAERHLISLWSAVRDAARLLGDADGGLAWAAPQLGPLLQALAVDARRLADLLEEQAKRAPHLAAARAPEPRAAILLVDDDPITLAGLRELLSAEFEVHATVDPAEVPQRLAAAKIDAVVTDLSMPGLDGMALLELVQRDEHPPPVLFVSGSLDADRRREALQRGAFDFVSKPVDVPELAARIHRAVRHARDLEHQRELQQTDELTGLPNRRAFLAALRGALADRRSPQRALAVVFVDQNGLKQVNDAWGHPAGDRAIVQVARALQQARRSTDVVARLGADEFAIVMPGADAASAVRVMERARDELAANPLPLPGGASLALSVSWGVSLATPDDRGADGAALIARADAALYAMKRAGRLAR